MESKSIDQSGSPRRTKDKILETALRLFNELGEPHVTTTTIAEEMKISPGNLYYHYRNKDDIITSIFGIYEVGMDKRLRLPDDHRLTLEEAWGYIQYLTDYFWQYRFLYRDINDLLARNRTLEIHFKSIVERKIRFAQEMCKVFAEDGDFIATPAETETICTNIGIIGTYWLSFQFVLNPRQYNDAAIIRKNLHAISFQVISLMAPFLRGHAREKFEELAANHHKTQAAI